MAEENERTETTRLSDDGTRLVIVTRWLDRQMSPPRWRTKNRTRKLNRGEIEYFREGFGHESGMSEGAKTSNLANLGASRT